jgi:hypothetical protein
MMSHPDPRVAEALERTAAELATATTAPPPELADDPAAYMEWLRTRPAPEPGASQRPRARREYLDRSEIPRKWPRWRERPAQPSVHPTPGTVPELPDGYDAAVAKLRTLPDFGAASLEAARAEHPDWEYADLVVHAAAHPVQPAAEPTEDTSTDRPTAITPVCEDCGTVLDPDRTCWTCSSTPTAKASA